jgi:nicotinamide-nucleotide amidase
MNNAIDRAAELLIDKNLTIAFAESATAGRAAADFSLACNAGKFLKGALVCYDASIKTDLLKVPKQLIEEFTPESMEVTKLIAEGLSSVIPADIHIGITGLPCPGGSETEEKPVGTMFVYAVHKGTDLFSERLQFDGNHLEIVVQTVEQIAVLLSDRLKSL